jgi:hypothetical protein
MADKDTKEQTVEQVDTTVATADNDSSKSELAATLTNKDDAKLHPTGVPSTETEKEPGGNPATEPNRPPFATNRSDTPIISSLATGAGQHTPPDPATVDADGNVRPVKMEAAGK